MKCYCCGEERESAMIASLLCHDDIKVCRVCIGWLRQRAGGLEVTPTLPVADMDAAVAFYESGGFDVERYDDGFAFGEYDEQSVFNLALEAGMDPSTNHAGCYVVTKDVEDWHTRFVSAGLEVTEIEDMPWGMTEFTLTDPSGNHVRVGRSTDQG